MADEITKVEATQTEGTDTNTETKVETKEEVVNPVEEKKSFIKEMKEKLFGKSEAKTDESKNTDTKGTESKVTETTKEGEEIPDEFTEAAKSAGWTEEQIVEHAGKFTKEQLMEQIAQLLEDQEKTEEVEEKKEESQKEIAKSDNKDDRIAALEAKLAAMEQGISKYNEQEKKTQVVQRFTTANEFLDKLAEKTDAFGQFKDLPKLPDGRYINSSAEFKARAEVFNTAKMFEQGGMPWQSALENAAAWYSGRFLDKTAERNVIKRLKDSGKKVSPARVEKSTSKKYDNPRDQIKADMMEIARNAGVEVEE